MTRVAVVASWYPSAEEPVGGIFVRDQAEVLAQRFEVGVVAPHTLTVRGVVRGRVATPSMPEDAGAVRVVRPTAARFRLAPSVETATWERALVRGLQHLWPRGRPDLIHAHVVLPGGLAAVRVGRRLDIPVVLTEHASPFSMHLRTDRGRELAGQAVRGAARVLAVGDGLAAEIRALVDIPVEVIPNVVHPAFFEPQLPGPRLAGPIRLLAVGYHRRQKRFDVLIAAMARAVNAGFDAELVIVGEGPLRAEIFALAERLGVRGRVTLESMTDRPGLLNWLQWCDLVVSTSDHESFGLFLAEALAVGRPVVTTASGGPQAFVEPALGRIVPIGNIEALAENLVATSAWLQGFRPAVARARMAERFGPERLLSRVGAVYDEVLAKRGRSHATE